VKRPSARLWTKRIEILNLVDLDRAIMKGNAPSKENLRKIREAVPCTVYLNNRKVVEIQTKLAV